MSLPYKIEYNENLNLRHLGFTNYFKNYFQRGLYTRSGIKTINGQYKTFPNDFAVNDRWGIYDQLVTISGSTVYGGFRNEFIEDVMVCENTSPHRFGHLSFKHMRWLCQDVINRGNLKPIPIQVISKKVLDSKNIEVIPCNELMCKIDGESWWYSDDGKNLLKLHPGGTVSCACYFVGITVQALIFSLEEDEFNFGGDILSNGEINDIFVHGKDYKSFKESPYKTNVDRTTVKKVKKIGFPRSEGFLKDGHWLHSANMHDSVSYGSIFRKSFPLNVYIGADSKEEFDKCCSRITKVREKIFNQSDNISKFDDFFYDEKSFVSENFDYILDMYDSESEEYDVAQVISNQIKSILPCETKSAKINFIQISQSDYMNVPKYNNYKGFSAYLNSETDWERDIFDLFFLGNSKIAKSYLGNDLIFYNCEHPIWKYDIECHESDTIKIPSEFCKSIVGN